MNRFSAGTKTLFVVYLLSVVGCMPAIPDQRKPKVTTPAVQAIPPAEVPMETVKAEAGVAKQGRSLDEHEGVYVTPAKAFFTAKERIVFDIQVVHALQLYKATSGEGPKTQEEFMQKVIEENQIKLPELPAGHRYQYNVEKEELEVVRPAKQ